MANDGKGSDSSPDNQGGGDGQTVPYSRFIEVNDRMKAAELELAAFKELGFSAPELGEVLQITDAMAAHIQKQKEAEGEGKPAPAPAGAEEQEAQKFRDSIYKAIPGLKELEGLPKQREQEAQVRDAETVRQRQARGERAVERLKGLAKKAGYTDEHLPFLEPMMTGLINKDPKLTARFNDGDLEVVNEVFDYYTGTLVGPAARSRSAGAKRVKDANQQELSPRPKGGSPKGPEGEKPPKTIEEADQKAMEFLEEHAPEIPGEGNEEE